MGRTWSLALFGVGALGCTSAPDDLCTANSPGIVCEVAGNGQQSFNSDGLPALETALYLPSEARRGPDGLVYIMDFNNFRMRRIEADGTVSTVVGDGSHAGAIEGVLATSSSLESPIDFDFMPDGRLVFVSYHDPRVMLVDTDGMLKLIAGSSLQGVRGNDGDGGPADQARFFELSGIAVAPDGSIFVSDDSANRVRVIRNGTIDTYAGNGSRAYAGDGGLAKDANLSEPTALSLDAAGNLFVADAGNHVIRKISPDGIISTVAGNGARGFSGDGGPASNAQLAGPDGIAVGPDGTLFIGDRFNSRVRMVTPDGTISTIAGTGTRGLSGQYGPAREAEFNYLTRVQLDSDGGLFVADQANSCVRKIQAPF